MKGIRREFESSIDEYLAWCEEDKARPRNPFFGDLNVDLDPELRREAPEEGESINSGS